MELMEWFPDFIQQFPLGLPEASSKSDPLFSCSKRLADDQLNATERKDTHKKNEPLFPALSTLMTQASTHKSILFTHQQMHYLLNLEMFKKYTRIHTNIAPTCFGVNSVNSSANFEERHHRCVCNIDQ
jgi:hypothetical protein